MSRLFNSETLKDEYHESLERCMERLMLHPKVCQKVRDARTTNPNAYVALAGLAHEHGHNALLLGVRLFAPTKP